MPTPSSLLVAGVDIGGTNVRCALAQVESPGQILVRRSTKTPSKGGVGPILDVIKEEINHCLQELDCPRDAVVMMGCAVPGITNAAEGIVIEAANLPGWHNIALTALLEERFAIPVLVANDVNAAALGEYTYGAGQGCHSLVYLTISTGVAAGIVVEGQLLRGAHHAAGELGYFVPDPIHLGKKWEPSGCLEMTSAGIGLSHSWANLQGGPATSDRAKEVFEAAEAGHPEAEALIHRAANYLSQATIAIGNIIDPDCLVLGGSIALHQAKVFNHIQETLSNTLLFPPEVVRATLGGDAPLIGVLTLAAQKVPHPS